MQQLNADVFISVDGWAGSAVSPAYFGYGGPELEEWIRAELAAPQLLVLGRRTYEILSSLPEEARDEASQRMTELETVVFSGTLEHVERPNARVCSGDLAAEVERLKREGDVPLRTMGSLSVVRQLIAAGLVDRLRLMTFPLLVGGSGRERLFEQTASADLELADHRVLDGRLMLLEYRPTGKDIPRA